MKEMTPNDVRQELLIMKTGLEKASDLVAAEKWSEARNEIQTLQVWLSSLQRELSRWDEEANVG